MLVRFKPCFYALLRVGEHPTQRKKEESNPEVTTACTKLAAVLVLLA